jgi:TRAP-type C4-dicarboxylate transport system permease small subunit
MAIIRKFHCKLKPQRKPLLNILFLSFIAIFLILTIFHDSFHNHEFDGHDHKDCPVFPFITALYALVVIGIILAIFYVKIYWEIFFVQPVNIQRISSKSNGSRAPPVGNQFLADTL